jgi:hypothetical protein
MDFDHELLLPFLFVKGFRFSSGAPMVFTASGNASSHQTTTRRTFPSIADILDRNMVHLAGGLIFRI